MSRRKGRGQELEVRVAARHRAAVGEGGNGRAVALPRAARGVAAEDLHVRRALGEARRARAPVQSKGLQPLQPSLARPVQGEGGLVRVRVRVTLILTLTLTLTLTRNPNPNPNPNPDPNPNPNPNP